MKELFNHIKSVKENFDSLMPLSLENQQRLDKKLRLEWNFNSNHMEGNTLTYGETELLLIFDQTKGNHEMREYEEMKGHDVALKLIYDLADDKERILTEKFIRELNEIILVRPFYKEAITLDGQDTRRLIKIGEYKAEPNSVRLANGEIFNYPSPQQTPALMNDLMQWYNNVSATENAIEVAALLHYKFVCIHPFDDGNGRIARLLMNYHLIKNNYLPVIIKTEDKKKYLFALREADVGNIDAIIEYIGNRLLESYKNAIQFLG
jgi:Fic family protein